MINKKPKRNICLPLSKFYTLVIPKHQNLEKGFAAFLMAILVSVAMTGIAISITVLTIGELRIARNITKSTQAYYTAEAGIEDALLRLVKGLKWSRPYTINVDGVTTTVEISDVVGGSRNITSRGESLNRIRKIRVVYEVSSEKVAFHYGTQVGDGGIEMKDNSQIRGNVSSNGSILASGGALTTGTVIVARNGNKIEGLNVGEDAKVYQCIDSKIGKILTTADNQGCTASTIQSLTEEISPIDMPISTSTIQKWKDEAVDGGTQGSLSLSGDQTLSLGPKKIEGDLLIQNQAKLIMIGTIWVTGNINLKNNAILELDSGYGSESGVIIADGSILVENNVIARGSGQEGSYLMLLSTNSSLDPSNPAIEMKNNAQVDILYSSNGLINLINNANLRSICAYKLLLQNNVVLIYEVGLENTSFSSGPGGGWKVTSWKEVE